MQSLLKKLFFYPTRAITVSFAAAILIGTFLLSLPISSKGEVFTPLLDCLFTATSATCVTGLIVFDTYTHWSLFGQLLILALIQMGGLGLVTLTTFFHIAIGKKMGLRSMHLAQESVGSLDASPWEIVRTVVKTSLLVEGAGALLLLCSFFPRYGTKGIWIAVFLSVSAFCNAGFDILGFEGPFVSLCNYNDDPIVIFTITMLIIIGGIGFVVIHDLMAWRKTRQVTLHTRVVLTITAILLLLGFFATAIFEWNNPQTLGALPSVWQRLNAAWFHSVSSRTAGFNTLALDQMSRVTLVFTCLLMFIGAAPGSTGGGIKCTTVAVLVMTVWCVIRGDEETVIFRRRVERGAVYKSLAVMILALLGVSITAGCITATMYLTHQVSGLEAMFESVSAFATVGLSVGVSANANPLAKTLLIFLMYMGRLGPITFFLSLALRARPSRREVLPEGKIQIGENKIRRRQKGCLGHLLLSAPLAVIGYRIIISTLSNTLPIVLIAFPALRFTFLLIEECPGRCWLSIYAAVPAAIATAIPVIAVVVCFFIYCTFLFIFQRRRRLPAYLFYPRAA